MAQARVRSQANPCENFGGQSGTGTGFSPSTSVFPCQFHSTGAALKSKSKRYVFGAVTGRLCWSLAQLLGDCAGLWRSYWEIVLVFGAVTGRLFCSLAQLLGDYFDLWCSYWEIILVF
jgi:hypothetical protein